MNLAYFAYVYSQVILAQEHFQTRVPESVMGLFGTSFSFILKFFGGVFLLFLLSALVSHLLKLNKYYDELGK